MQEGAREGSFTACYNSRAFAFSKYYSYFSILSFQPPSDRHMISQESESFLVLLVVRINTAFMVLIYDWLIKVQWSDQFKPFNHCSRKVHIFANNCGWRMHKFTTFCRSVCLFICLSLCLSVCLSVCPSVFLQFSLYVGLSICISLFFLAGFPRCSVACRIF